jgi:hypothetical protein
MNSFYYKTLLLQGIYYTLTALWPLVHIDSFMLVTGPKYDIWLVKTVGILLLCSGISFCLAGMQERLNIPILFLALTEALGLMYVDIYYTLTDTISKIYLADALAELLIVIALVTGVIRTTTYSETPSKC